MGISKTNIAILVISMILFIVFLGGIVSYSVIQKDDLSASQEIEANSPEEMQKYLVAEYEGKTIKYTGERVEELQPPFAIGDKVNMVYFDTSANIKDWVLSLDWSKAYDISQDMDTKEMIYLVLADGLTFEYLNGCFLAGQSPDYGIAILGVEYYQSYHDPTNVIYKLYCGENIIWRHYVNGSSDYEGWNSTHIDPSNPAIELNNYVISDILPEYLNKQCYFFTFEEGNFGSMEAVYEPDNYYTIVANEDGDGYHFSLVSGENN